MSIDIENYLIQMGISYNKKTDSYVILCPFHNDRHPSMTIYENSGMCVCFSCGKKIHFRNFIKELDIGVYKRDYKVLNNNSNLNTKKDIKCPERIVLKLPKGYEQLDTDISNLGITKEMIKYFNIGYCKVGFKNKVNKDICKGCYFYDKDREKIRWITNNNICSFSNQRIMIPDIMGGKLYDIESRDITGRALKKVFFPNGSKGSYTIFNYDRLDKKEPLYVVEGRKSCLKLWKEISKNSTAIFNNRIKEGQKKLLKEFNHVIIIPDNGEAGEMLVEDFKDLNIPLLEIVRLPKVLYCKKCKIKFRGEEKRDICPNCKEEGLSYVDVFDLDKNTLLECINNRVSSVKDILTKFKINDRILMKRERVK